ncbi:MAG TPA: ATP-binding protein [Pelobium sp.]|nr:ATP-binding protein [Pelobium sp.]
MKKVFFLLLVLFAYQSQAQLKLTKIWETKDLATPESVLVLGDLLYVSLIDGDGAKADGVGGIAILKPDGTVLNKEWVTGLNAPKGLGYFKGKIYVADLNEVVKIDIKSAKIEARTPIKEAVFLNDIAVNSKGEVFVSDTRLGKVYRIVDGKAEVFLTDVKNANGLKFIGDELYILSGPTLVKIDENKKQHIISSGLASGGDGLEPFKKGEYLATCWVGLIYHIKADGSFDLLLDSREEKINTADIGFDPKKNNLYVPTFLKNSVAAYKIE